MVFNTYTMSIDYINNNNNQLNNNKKLIINSIINAMSICFYLLSILSVRFAFSSPFPFFILHLYNPVSSLPGF